MIYSPEESFKRRDFFNAYADSIFDTFGNVFELYKPTNESELIEFYYKDIGIQEGDRVLDVGCGTGIIDIKLSNYFNNVKFDGIDICDNLLDRGFHLLNASGNQDKVRLRQGDFHYLSSYYPEKFFDKILLLESFFYNSNPGLLLKEIKKVLKPDGKVYIRDVFLSNRDKELDGLVDDLKNFLFLNLLNIESFLSLFLRDAFELEHVSSTVFSYTEKEMAKKRLEFLYKVGVNAYNYSDLFKDFVVTRDYKRPYFFSSYSVKFTNSELLANQQL